MSQEELQSAPLVRLSISGNIVASVIAVLTLLGAIILYTASKTDAGQVEKIVDYKLAPIKEILIRIDNKLDSK